ncbi:MAG: Co2+/Mg2+ efflux protein ApaG [Cellvibrionaceae bacterium]|nr:Co2+/Mg2+ efflux protein ApaG [Cellvibrionaceae bacterium]|tara:strand:- start:48 stop:422 length:375 start_codon:yes stop_codon:yes gene_type:complete
MNPDHINIDVKTQYLADQSEPQQEKYVFSYTITIRNQSEENTQLISRRWKIVDANDSVQEVAGIGVVGEQPIIAPGDEYTYTSGSVLDTDTGTMEGSYQMRDNDGNDYDVIIPTFALVHPERLH